MKLSVKNLVTGLGAGTTMSLLYAQSAFAQTTKDAFTNYSGSVEQLEFAEGNLLQLISQIVNVVLIIVGILAVMYLVYGGILYLTAGGNPESAAKGRTAITNAIIGIVIIVLALAIYNFVVGNIG